METDELMRPSEVAHRLNVSRAWVYAAAKDGRLPAIRIGGADGPLRFDSDEIEAVIARARASWRPTDSAADTLRRAS